MFDWENWVQTVWNVLQTDDEACLNLIMAAGGRLTGMITLVDGDTSFAEALAYARTLFELGSIAEAHDILTEVLRVAFSLLT